MVLVNMMVFVALALAFGEVTEISQAVGTPVVFTMAVLAVIPLSYYIGKGIANISARSNYAVGAVLNATFGSIVEIIIYFQALAEASGNGKALVRSSLVGTMLGTMLLIPGLCMVVGGLKFQEQRFNLQSAGVSSSLLFVAVAGAFCPTLYQRVHSRNWYASSPDRGENEVVRGCVWSSTGVPAAVVRAKRSYCSSAGVAGIRFYLMFICAVRFLRLRRRRPVFFYRNGTNAAIDVINTDYIYETQTRSLVIMVAVVLPIT